MAEWSKALASGPSPQGRGFEPHSCHCESRHIAPTVRNYIGFSPVPVPCARAPCSLICPPVARYAGHYKHWNARCRVALDMQTYLASVGRRSSSSLSLDRAVLCTPKPVTHKGPPMASSIAEFLWGILLASGCQPDHDPSKLAVVSAL